MSFDELSEFAFEVVDRFGEFGYPVYLVARDPDLCVLGLASEPASGLLLPDVADVSARRHDVAGIEVVQVPAEGVDQRDALTDEPLAMV